MLARRTAPSIPVWKRDQLDSPYPPEVETSYFDESINAWLLSWHADIQVILPASSLVPGKPGSEDAEDSLKETAQLQLRTHLIDWQGGPIFRSPRLLWIYLRENLE